MIIGAQNLDREFWAARARAPIALTFIGHAGVRRHGPIMLPVEVTVPVARAIKVACDRCSYDWHLTMMAETRSPCGGRPR